LRRRFFVRREGTFCNPEGVNPSAIPQEKKGEKRGRSHNTEKGARNKKMPLRTEKGVKGGVRIPDREKGERVVKRPRCREAAMITGRKKRDFLLQPRPREGKPPRSSHQKNFFARRKGEGNQIARAEREEEGKNSFSCPQIKRRANHIFTS